MDEITFDCGPVYEQCGVEGCNNFTHFFAELPRYGFVGAACAEHRVDREALRPMVVRMFSRLRGARVKARKASQA